MSSGKTQFRVTLSLSCVGALLAYGVALANRMDTTPTGEREQAGDAQTWTFDGTVSYISPTNSCNQVNWQVDNTDAASFEPSPDVHYTNAVIYYRAALV